jgi:hypothetical protein
VNLTFLYIAALYAVALAIARRYVPIRIGILFYCVVLAALFRPLTGPYINFAADVIDMIPPWSAFAHVTKFNVSNLEIHDATMQLIPWGHQVREAWLHGHLPLWNALNGGGYPLLANGQSSALAPTRLLALPVPAPYWVAAEAALKLLIALTFTFVYLRRRGSSELATVAGAISFALSTYIIDWLHYAHSTVAVFTPAIFLAIDLLSERVTAQRIAFGAIVTALMVFGGHLESVIYIATMVIVYVAWIGFDRRFLGALVITLVAAIVLASPFLIPFARAATHSLRLSEVKTQTFVGVPFSDPPSLVLLIQPRFFGGRPLPWGPMSCETFDGFAGLLGIAGFVAFVFARQWRDRRFAFVVAALIAFAIVCDVPLFRSIAHWLLPYVALQRFRLVLCWCGAVFTAAIVDIGRERIAGVIATFAILAWLFLRWPFPSHDVKLASMTEAIPGVIVLILILIPRARPLVPAAVLVELLIAIRGWNPVMPASKFYPRTPLINALTTLAKDGSRMVGIGEPLYPNTNAMYGLASAQAHDPMEDAAYDERLHRAFGYNPHDYYAKWTDPYTPLLNVLGVRWIVTAPGVTLNRPLRYDGVDGRIYEVLSPRSREDGARSGKGTEEIELRSSNFE